MSARDRVMEIALTGPDGLPVAPDQWTGIRADGIRDGIRAVCKWLRNPMALTADGTPLGDPPRDMLADDIERVWEIRP